MNLSAPFIKRPIMTILLMISLITVGVYSYIKLPVSNLPDVSYPVINVTAAYPGADPSTMANNVASPLEREFLTISGLNSVTSTNTLGNSNLVLRFDLEKNIDSAALDVQAAISRAARNLPPDLPSAPTYRKVNPAQTPILFLALTSDTMPLNKMYDYGNSYIGQSLSKISGVAQVNVGGSPYAVRVQVDPGKIAMLGLTLQDLSEALVAGNPYLPSGYLDNEVLSSTIIANGQILNAEGYNELIAAYPNNSPVRFKDIGNAIDSLQNYRFLLRYITKDTNKPTVILSILPEPGANTVEITNDVFKALQPILQNLPSDLHLEVVRDKSISIRASIDEVQFTLILAFFLVILIIYIYLGSIRDTLIPALVLPISVISTFAIMYALGYSMNNLSLLALILAIGFIIDDAIVVIENIVRHVEMGENPWVASLEGAQQISFTILSMTLSLIAVFLPLIFMPGLLGRILAEFAITLTAITLISGAISITLTPMVCSLLITPQKEEKKGYARFSHKLNDAFLRVYKPALLWTLKHRYVALIVMLISLVASVFFIVKLPKDFIPNDDEGFFIAFTQAAEGTSYERMKQYQEQVNTIFSANPAIDKFISYAANQQFRNGVLYANLVPRAQRKAVLEVIGELQKETAKIPGLNVFYKNIPMIDLSIGSVVKGSYQFALQSLVPENLYQPAEQYINEIKKIPGIVGVNSDLEIKSPQLFVDILRDQASSLGVSALDIERTLALAYAGGRVSRINSPINQYDIILELLPEFQKNPSALGDIYVRSSLSSKVVPLNAVSKWHEGLGLASVNHTDQFPSVTIAFSIAPGFTLDGVLEKLKAYAKELLPKEVTGTVLGAAQAFEESVNGSAILLILTVFAIYVILGILYESFIHPLTILSTLPPAVIGGLLVLYLFNIPLSLYSFLGIILLIGIVKKNGIMIVDFALENVRLHGDSPEKSIYDACVVRFRPIMMTTLTAIMGAIPIALGTGTGAEARRPLGLVIIGGLAVSQMITLFVTPVIYLYLEKWSEKLKMHSAHRPPEGKKRTSPASADQPSAQP
ncbi:MAG: efflux RND transporter permease subunit [Parachlamydiales bacterium]|jgi:HAE1 family hydrophobic/amphiphilic exporter-1